MAITKISAIMLVIGLIVGIVAGYGAGLAVYQPRVKSLETDVETYKRLLIEVTGKITSMEVEVGQEFTIALESNPTTGYQWQLAKPLDKGILEFIGSEYKAPETEIIGGGGIEIWTFKAVGRGVAEISLKYARPWEKDVPPAKEQTFAIIVNRQLPAYGLEDINKNPENYLPPTIWRNEFYAEFTVVSVSEPFTITDLYGWKWNVCRVVIKDSYDYELPFYISSNDYQNFMLWVGKSATFNISVSDGPYYESWSLGLVINRIADKPHDNYHAAYSAYIYLARPTRFN